MHEPIPALPVSRRQFISSVGWQFAKTMPHMPHEYTLGGRTTAGVPPAPASWYAWFEQQIADYGYQARFGGRSYRYLNVGTWKYWVLYTDGGLMIINRALLPET
jgi:hypothetical protein